MLQAGVPSTVQRSPQPREGVVRQGNVPNYTQNISEVHQTAILDQYGHVCSAEKVD